MKTEEKKDTIGDDSFMKIFIYPALPTFLVVLGFHLYFGDPFLESVVLASLAGMTGPIGVLFTLAWLGDHYDALGAVLIWIVGTFIVLGVLYSLIASGYFIYKSIFK